MKHGNLNDIKIGESTRVKTIKAPDGVRRRLLDLGLTEGTTVKCVGQSPPGDPRAFLIRGAVFALRSEECSLIETEALCDDE